VIDTERQPRRQIRLNTYLFFLALFALIAFLTHVPLLRLPYYWDELGQFVPAALDLFHDGAWIPHSTLPNVHPPGVMAYLAAFWSLAGCSPLSTRLAMLLAATVAILVAFLLAIELCRNTRGAPAFMAVMLLCASPLFFAQAMLAQLDMPAMLFASLALLLFLQEKTRLAALACAALVLVKETGLIVPLVFGGWLLHEKRGRDAAWFLLPVLTLCAWLAVLARGTGHLFGNSDFTRYNLYYPFHPVRFAFALGRRLYYLFFQDFHWIGAIAIFLAWRRGGLFTTRAWKIAWLLVGAHVLFLSAIGGAMLERYLLPVLPVVYTAMVAAMSIYRPPLKIASQLALLAGLMVGNFWNPPYPFPFENNLAFTDFVRLQQDAAEFVEQRYVGRPVATAWPLTSALSRPELGYVTHPVMVRSLPDFTAATMNRLDWRTVRAVVLFSRTWEPEWSWTNIELVRKIWHRFYGYEPDVSIVQMGQRPVETVARWVRHGQSVEVYEVRAGGL
jgi:4-amino-4-deoxy-L-arabinose transferase-like glycosyltransferase